jgi:hypothetical protein
VTNHDDIPVRRGDSAALFNAGYVTGLTLAITRLERLLNEWREQVVRAGGPKPDTALESGCPPWCTRDHAGEPEGDRLHMSDADPVPLAVDGGTIPTNTTVTAQAAAVDLSDGGLTPGRVWISGAGDAELTPPDACRLAERIVTAAHLAGGVRS